MSSDTYSLFIESTSKSDKLLLDSEWYDRKKTLLQMPWLINYMKNYGTKTLQLIFLLQKHILLITFSFENGFIL